MTVETYPTDFSQSEVVHEPTPREAFETQKQIALDRVDADLASAHGREHDHLFHLEMTNNPGQIKEYKHLAKQDEIAIRHLAVARGLVYFCRFPDKRQN